ASGTCSKFPRTANVRPRTSAILGYLKDHPGVMASGHDPLLHEVVPMQPVASARHQMHITGHPDRNLRKLVTVPRRSRGRTLHPVHHTTRHRPVVQPDIQTAGIEVGVLHGDSDGG